MLNFPVPNKSLSGFQNFPSPSKLRWGFPDFRSSVIQKKEEPEPSSGFTAKSVILDIADHWGGTYFIGLRSVDFWHDGTKISLAATDFTAYATSEYTSDYQAENVFDTSLSKTGDALETQWYTSFYSTTNQRLIVVFDSSQTFDEIGINNSHVRGNNTDRGAKNVVIHYSTDSITDTTYNASISNSTKIFDGQFDEHSASDVEDEQTLTLII